MDTTVLVRRDDGYVCYGHEPYRVRRGSDDCTDYVL